MKCDRCSREDVQVQCGRCDQMLCSCRTHLHAMNCINRDVNTPIARDYRKEEEEPRPVVKKKPKPKSNTDSAVEKKKSSREKLKGLSRLKVKQR